MGKQRIEDTGPLTTKRMEACDDEFVAAAFEWIGNQHEAGTPFFCWVNTTHMHAFTHPKPESVGQAGRWQSVYHDVLALRFDNWKLVFMEQRTPGTLQVWMEPFVPLRIPKVYNLRTDPFERADITSNTYYDWLIDRAWIFVPAQAYVAQMLQTLADFPPRQEPASFSLDKVMEKLRAGIPSS